MKPPDPGYVFGRAVPGRRSLAELGVMFRLPGPHHQWIHDPCEVVIGAKMKFVHEVQLSLEVGEENLQGRIEVDPGRLEWRQTHLRAELVQRREPVGETLDENQPTIGTDQRDEVPDRDPLFFHAPKVDQYAHTHDGVVRPAALVAARGACRLDGGARRD